MQKYKKMVSTMQQTHVDHEPWTADRGPQTADCRPRTADLHKSGWWAPRRAHCRVALSYHLGIWLVFVLTTCLIVLVGPP